MLHVWSHASAVPQLFFKICWVNATGFKTLILMGGGRGEYLFLINSDSGLGILPATFKVKTNVQNLFDSFANFPDSYNDSYYIVDI